MGPRFRSSSGIVLQTELLRDSVAHGEPAATDVLRFADVQGGHLDPDKARQAIAKDHCYTDWTDALAHGQDTVDTRFEAASDAIHAGDVDTLRRFLVAD